MNSTIKEVFEVMNSTHSLAFTKDLIDEHIKLKAYGYSSHEINKAYDQLMVNESKAISFLARDEELMKYLTEEFFELVLSQGE